MKLEHINNIVQGLVHPDMEVLKHIHSRPLQGIVYYSLYLDGIHRHNPYNEEYIDNIDLIIKDAWRLVNDVSKARVCDT